jgi:hypothetical protein
MDNYGRIGRSEAVNSEPKDGYARLWTDRSTLQNRRVQVRLLTYPAPEPPDLSRLQPRGVYPALGALTSLDIT